MSVNTAPQLFLPSIQDDQKIEVLLENDEAVIKLSTWTENLGWSCQKTMRLQASMLEDLHQLLTAARYKMNQQKTGSDKTVTGGAKVLNFPAPAKAA